MHRGAITVHFDVHNGQHYYFLEWWELQAPSAEEAMKRLHRIAQGRVGLLARNARLVRITMKGARLQRPMLRGAAGAFAHPQDKLLLRRDGVRAQRAFCGVARKIFQPAQGLSPIGMTALETLNQILRECECVMVRNEKPEPIGNLQAHRMQAKLAKNCKKATKKNLISMLGPEEGEITWASLHAERKLGR